MQNAQSRRKTIVINSRFQYQYSLGTVALAVLLINLFLIARMAFPGENPLTLTTSTALLIAALESVMIALVWWGSLKQSHRIAGPVYVFNRDQEVGVIDTARDNGSVGPTAPFPAIVGDHIVVTYETEQQLVTACVVLAEGTPSDTCTP